MYCKNKLGINGVKYLKIRRKDWYSFFLHDFFVPGTRMQDFNCYAGSLSVGSPSYQYVFSYIDPTTSARQCHIIQHNMFHTIGAFVLNLGGN
jgi:hypothetical protein